MKFSEGLGRYVGKLPITLQDSISEIETYFKQKIDVLKYDDEHVAIPVSINVNLPPRGPVDGIDIREKEPMLVKFSLAKYPSEMPELLSDRKDFPKNKLAHLYASRVSAPASLCLVRNNPNEWYANHRVSDLLVVGEQWLFKAGAGLLTNDGGEFDPTRITYTGFHIYQYQMFRDIVQNDERFNPRLPASVFLSGNYLDQNRPKKEEILKTLTPVPLIMKEKMVELIKTILKEDNKTSLPLFSLLVWTNENNINDEYNTDLPNNFKELNLFLLNRGIDVVKTLNMFYENNLNLCTHIPIVLAIKRSRKMVGYDGSYEFITFVVDVRNCQLGKYDDKAEVSIRAHIEPFSIVLASKLTGEMRQSSTMFVGAGSLGSKIILHDARSGKVNIGVVDSDKFLEHNLARHVLFPIKVGWNKSSAVVDEISSFFSTETKQYKAFDSNVEDLSSNDLKNYNWLVDTTASTLVLNNIAARELHNQLNVSRCEIVDDGRLGLLYIEGKGRNPRIDDLVNLAYFYAIKNSTLREWRMRDALREVTNIDVGLGCSSTTTVMPDDEIAFHASVFSKLLSKQSGRISIKDDGLIYLSILADKNLPDIRSDKFLVKPFDIIRCQAGSNWELRVIPGLIDKLFKLCRAKGRIETGGVLVGLSNYKTKTIHVFDLITEPQDSKGTCNGFLRGAHGLPAQINKIRRTTGEAIGYIGEWHTHPMDLEHLSSTDMATIEELKLINRKTPIPTCAVIVTNSKVLPFIFE